MSNMLKIIVRGGVDDGLNFDGDLASSLLVGRSRSADIRLREPDVSGRHFEFIRVEGGVIAKTLSHHGLIVDGKAVGEGDSSFVRVGSVLRLGVVVQIEIVELPETTGTVAEVPSEAVTMTESEEGTDFFASEEAPAMETNVEKTPPPATEAEGDDAATHGDFEDALTAAGEDGETQEMKTRVGSMEEIFERKRQLDRASTARRWKFGLAIVGVMLLLGCVWLATGSNRHVSDAEGPFLPNGEPDLAEFEVINDKGEVELALEYPNDPRKKVSVSEDKNSFEAVSYLGIDRDVPFRIEFKRWSDIDGLQQSLEESFARRCEADAAEGITFAAHGFDHADAEFFEEVFPGYCEAKSLHGVRFMRREYTRSLGHELWHGVMLYMRRGDLVYRLRTEIPDVYWKRGGYRVSGEPHIAICRAFSSGFWDSPGRAGLIDRAIGDDDLLVLINRELSADRVAAWPTLIAYIDTLLVRSWGEKPTMQKVALSHYRTLLEKMNNLYNERQLAYRTARINRDVKRMRSIFNDCKAVFGPMKRDRRSVLINNPEVWSCPQR